MCDATENVITLRTYHRCINNMVTLYFSKQYAMIYIMPLMIVYEILDESSMWFIA